MAVGKQRMAAAWAALWVIVSSPGPGVATQGPPTFRSGVELISVDAAVVGRSGDPIPGLTAADFDVSVDGRPRAVVSAQYVDLTGASPQAAASAAPPAFTSNELDPARPVAPPDRLVVLAVDHSSFLPGGGRHTLQAARRFLDHLDASDRVALVAYPDPGVFVAPTTDRRAVAAALGRVAGSAERIEPAHLELNIGLHEAIEIAAGSRSAYERVVTRECTGPAASADNEYCRAIVELDAPLMVAQLRARTARSLNGLTGLLENLTVISGRKTLVLASAGLAASAERAAMDIAGELRVVTDLAARAETTIHVLHVDTALIDAGGADRRRAPVGVRADADLMALGLESIVDQNGGALYRVPAGADQVLARIDREMSAYYVIGIEPEPGDRDGKPHAIRVRVRGRETTVRHRRQFTILKPTAADASPDETLATVLRAGQTLRDLPVRVATQVLRDLTSARVRVVVRADVGRGAAIPAYLRVGMAVFDDTGQPAGSTSTLRQFAPTAGPHAVWPFQEIVTLRPGAYTLRLAVRDADGRVGSVVHPFVARLTSGRGARFSDLLVIDPDQGARAQMSTVLDGRVHGGRLNTFVEVYPDKGTSVSHVVVALSGPGSGAAIASQEAGLSTHREHQRVVARADLDLTRLAPGEYTLTATAFDGRTPLGEVRRRITRIDVAADAVGAAASGSSAGAEPFVLARVFEPDVVRPFIDRALQADPGSVAGAAAAIEALTSGRGDAALDALPAGEGLAASFVRGLVLLSTGGVERAAAQFRETLRASRTFAPAAFYLGACYAAGGRDAEAIEAWRAALLSAPDDRIVHLMLADAWLRGGQADEAAAVLAAALARWPGDAAMARRLELARSRRAPL